MPDEARLVLPSSPDETAWGILGDASLMLFWLGLAGLVLSAGLLVARRLDGARWVALSAIVCLGLSLALLARGLLDPVAGETTFEETVLLYALPLVLVGAFFVHGRAGSSLDARRRRDRDGEGKGRARAGPGAAGGGA